MDWFLFGVGYAVGILLMWGGAKAMRKIRQKKVKQTKLED